MLERLRLVDSAVIDEVNSERRHVNAYVYGEAACITRTGIATAVHGADGLSAIMPLMATATSSEGLARLLEVHE